jgi:hypothetical protein
VQKWAKFMNSQRPYNGRWRLCSLWSHLLRTRKLTQRDDIDHDIRREQWNYILSPPTYVEYFHYITDSLYRTWHALFNVVLRFSPYFWQMLSVGYSLVTAVVCRNTIASSAFALVSVCAYLSVVPQSIPSKRVGRVHKAR